MLNTKVGIVTPKNLAFLFAVYYHALNDTLKVIFNAKCTEEEKLQGVIYICNNVCTRELAAYKDFPKFYTDGAKLLESIKDLFLTLVKLLLSVQNIPSELVNDYCEAGIFASAAAQDADDWISLREFYIDYLIGIGNEKKANNELTDLKKLLPTDPIVAVLTAKFKKAFNVPSAN